MRLRTLADIVNNASSARFAGTADPARTEIRGISTDSRSIAPGELFIALKGENFDGHNFVEGVRERGAAAAVVSSEWAKDHQSQLPLVVVPDPLAAYGELARAHRRSFSFPVVAIAGSNGKTTTKELVAAVLSRKFNVLKTTGNLNNLIGVPATMLRLSEQHTAAVVEIGTNTPGEIEKLCAILEPTHGVITNVGREHLELLGSIEGVAEEEGALFRYLDAQGGMAFVNCDDEQIRRLAEKLQKKTTYSLCGNADVSAEVERVTELGSPVLRLEHGEKDRAIVTLRLPGTHSATNALAATAVGVHFGLSFEDIRSVLEEFEPLQSSTGYARLAPIRAKNGAVVLNDTYNANPDSMLVAFNAMRAIPLREGGRRIVVLGDMKELGGSSNEEHRALGRAIATDAAIDAAYFFGSEMRLAYEATQGSAVKGHSFTDKPALLAQLQKDIQPNDLVLVKGSRSMKMEEVVAALV